MSEIKANEILSAIPELTDEEKGNILACIREHHGAKKFTSTESEICCNADCYRFASVKGALGGMIYGRRMEINDYVKLYSMKADEKWNALTIEACKEELQGQYKLIKQFLNSLK